MSKFSETFFSIFNGELNSSFSMEYFFSEDKISNWFTVSPVFITTSKSNYNMIVSFRNKILEGKLESYLYLKTN